MLELVYTATPCGLISGRSGFSTVAMTEGFPPNLVSPMENLSGYKALFPPESPEAEKNPANFSYQLYNTGAKAYGVVSRIVYAGLSYTGRSNHLAHHLIFSRQELLRCKGGAARVVACDRNFPPYAEPPHNLPPKSAPAMEEPHGHSAWEKLCGSQDWARVVAERFRADRTRMVILQFTPGEVTARQILELVQEVTELLTPEEQFDFTFSTYCYQSAIGNPIFLRAYSSDSTFLASVRRLNPESIIVIGKDNPIGAEDLQLLAKADERIRQEKAVEERRAAAQQASDVEKAGAAAAEMPETDAPATKAGLPETENSRREISLDAALKEAPSAFANPAEGHHGKKGLGLVLCGIAAVVALCVVLAVVLLKNNPDLENLSGMPKVPEAQAKAEVTETPDSQAPVAEKNNVPAAAPSVSGQQKAAEPAQAVGKPSGAAPASRQPVRPGEKPTLTPGERLDFYWRFKLKGETEIQLPRSLATCRTLQIDVSQIGENAHLPAEVLKEAVLSEGTACTVFSVRKMDDGDGMFDGGKYVPALESNAARMEFRVENGILSVREPARSPNAPRLDNVSRIVIDGMELYNGSFAEEFVDVLQERNLLKHSLHVEQTGNLVCTLECLGELKDFRNLSIQCRFTNRNSGELLEKVTVVQAARQDVTLLGGLAWLTDRNKLLNDLEIWQKQLETCKDKLKKTARLKVDLSDIEDIKLAKPAKESKAGATAQNTPAQGNAQAEKQRAADLENIKKSSARLSELFADATKAFANQEPSMKLSGKVDKVRGQFQLFISLVNDCERKGNDSGIEKKDQETLRSAVASVNDNLSRLEAGVSLSDEKFQIEKKLENLRNKLRQNDAELQKDLRRIFGEDDGRKLKIPQERKLPPAKVEAIFADVPEQFDVALRLKTKD